MKWRSDIAGILTIGWVKTGLLYLAVISVLLHGVFLPSHTLFSNDGSLGELMAQCHGLPGRFFGCWSDLNNVGFNSGAAPPNIGFGLEWLMGPVLFSKFYAMVSLLILGLSAGLFFRELQLAPLACALGGLAVILSSNYFSVACWGMSPHILTVAMGFLALAALANPTARQRWLRAVLAGMAVGMGVSMGADVGAIFSLFVAVFIVYQGFIGEGSRARNLVTGIGRLVLVAACALFLAASSVYSLVTTAIEGQVGTEQNVQTREQQWGWATQWSLPKREALGLIVPGLFGYRTAAPNESQYWGLIGQDPTWENYRNDKSQEPPKGFFRYSGGGYYVGVLVALVAAWVSIQSLRPKNSIFSLQQRQWLWFWEIEAVLSLFLGFGRFAPFYRWFYALPYASTIRNPIKFLYLFNFAVLVLFAFGVDALWRKFMQPNPPGSSSRSVQKQGWWKQAGRFEKNWVYGCAIVWVVSLLAWLVYAKHRDALAQYLQSVRIDPSMVDSVAGFSIHHVGWFILFFLLAACLLISIFNGAFAGRQAGLGGFLMAALLVADLGWANEPWVVYWNYRDKYASNPIIDLLRDKPYEHRVALAPLVLPPNLIILNQLYRDEWLQHQFPFFDVQSFDVVQTRKMPMDLAAFMAPLMQTNTSDQAWLTRRIWQLTNTRYILGTANLDDIWIQQEAPVATQLSTVARFSILPKPGVIEPTNFDQLTTAPNDEGSFGLFKFADALPRAKLYDHWQTDTNDSTVLKQLFSPAFNPETSVFVAGGVPVDPPTDRTNHSTGMVDFVRYAPKDIVLKADATLPSVLLLNDHYDPNWKVMVDGKPEKLLRCNYLMRGVYLLPGLHTVEFAFQPPVGLLYVSLAAVAVGLFTLGLVLVSTFKNRPAAPMSAASSSPTSSQLQPNRNRNSSKKNGKHQPAKR